MGAYFVPYSGRKVATVDIKGRRVVILSKDKEMLEDGLHLLGADRMKKIVENNPVERESLFIDLANKAKSNLVIAPEEVPMSELLSSLEEQFAWVQ